MSEPTGETNSRNEQDELRQEWEQHMLREGTPLTSAVRQVINILVSNGTRPGDTTERRSERRANRNPENTQQSRQRGNDPHKEEHHGEKEEFEYGAAGKKLEKIMAELSRDAEITEKPPIGKVTDLTKFTEADWEEHGWQTEQKGSIEQTLKQKLKFSDEQVARTIDALLLAGYDSQEASQLISENQDILNSAENQRYGGGAWQQQVLENVFPLLQKSATRTIFGRALRDSQEFQLDPDSIEGLAWQMGLGGSGSPSTWKVGAKFALLEARLKTKEEREEDMKHGDKSWGKYYINESNFLFWFRTEVEDLYDIKGPNTPVNFGHEIIVRKQFAGLTLDGMLEQRGKLFNSEDGQTTYQKLWLQVLWEINQFQNLYEQDIHYRQAMSDEKVFVEEYKKMTYMNPLTKLGFRTNLIQKLASDMLDFREGRTGENKGKTLSDNKLGSAWVEMVLAYYNLGDFTALQNVLGADSSFFTRNGILDAIREVTGERMAKGVGGSTILSSDRAKLFDEAFDDQTGKLKDRKKFTQFINLFTTNLPDAFLELIVRRAILHSVAHKYNLNIHAKNVEVSMSLTEAKAWFFNRLMGGGARNDDAGNPSVHDAMGKFFYLDANRRKYARGEGKPYGNELTLGKHMAAAIIPMMAITTEQKVAVYDDYGRYIGERSKSILEALQDLHKLRTDQQQVLNIMDLELRAVDNPEEKERIMRQLDQRTKEFNSTYQNEVGQINFLENAQREYVTVHLEPGLTWMNRVMKGEGIDFGKFVHFDSFGGVRFERQEFIQKIQGDLIGKVRDMWKKYKYTNFNEDVRGQFINPKTGKAEWRDCKLGMLVFGYDELNRKDFWKQDKNGNYIKHNGLHEIDFNKIQTAEQRLQAVKQIILTEIAADMYRHQQMFSTDLRLSPVFYLNAIDALKNGILGKNIEIDELKKYGVNAKEHFFSDEDIAWLKERALNGVVLGVDLGPFGFHLKWWLSSLFDKTDKDGLGIGKMFSIIAKESLKSATS